MLSVLMTSAAWIQRGGYGLGAAPRPSSQSIPGYWSEAASSDQYWDPLLLGLGAGIIPTVRKGGTGGERGLRNEGRGAGKRRREGHGGCRTFCIEDKRESTDQGSWRYGSARLLNLCGNVNTLVRHALWWLPRWCWRCGAVFVDNLCDNVNTGEADHHPFGEEEWRSGRCGTRACLSLCGNVHFSFSDGAETKGGGHARRSCGSLAWPMLCDNFEALAQEEVAVRLGRNGNEVDGTVRWNILACINVSYNVRCCHWKGTAGLDGGASGKSEGEGMQGRHREETVRRCEDICTSARRS